MDLGRMSEQHFFGKKGWEKEDRSIPYTKETPWDYLVRLQGVQKERAKEYLAKRDDPICIFCGVREDNLDNLTIHHFDCNPRNNKRWNVALAHMPHNVGYWHRKDKAAFVHLPIPTQPVERESKQEASENTEPALPKDLTDKIKEMSQNETGKVQASQPIQSRERESVTSATRVVERDAARVRVSTTPWAAKEGEKSERMYRLFYGWVNDPEHGPFRGGRVMAWDDFCFLAPGQIGLGHVLAYTRYAREMCMSGPLHRWKDANTGTWLVRNNRIPIKAIRPVVLDEIANSEYSITCPACGGVYPTYDLFMDHKCEP
jgi:5-methylcytosine-specific restriction endonuclease McrA